VPVAQLEIVDVMEKGSESEANHWLPDFIADWDTTHREVVFAFAQFALVFGELCNSCNTSDNERGRVWTTVLEKTLTP